METNYSGPLVLRVQREEEGVEVRHFPVDHTSITLGRSLENDIVLRDRLTSRRHCQIERTGEGRLLMVDLGSQNGSRINGVLVARQILNTGDLIQLGNVRITVERCGEAMVPAVGPEATSAGKDIPRRERLLALVEINRALNAELHLGKLLSLVVDSALELTGGERGFLLLDEGEGLKCKVARNGDGAEIPAAEVTYSRRLAEEVRNSGEPRIAADALGEEDLKEIQSLVDLGVRSVLCSPLTVKRKVVGLLYVDHRLKTNAFQDEDLELLEAFADQAGIALDNAWLYQDLLDRKEELEQTTAEVARLNLALEKKIARQTSELLSARDELRHSRGDGYGGIIGNSPAIRQVFRLLDRYVETDDPVLIAGESGTGKELIARAIHRLGSRVEFPFVTENCAAIPIDLLESELFGYMRGAFTGANRNRKGLFEVADKGVLFLDEVGDMPLDIQKKLLRVLQESEVRPLGSDKPIKVNVRVLAATNRPLQEMVAEGSFREDLFYRLNVLPLTIPPLRERREDIALLVDFFLHKFADERKVMVPTVSPRAMDLLASGAWPGNVRQLENELKRAMILAEGEIKAEDLSVETRVSSVVATDSDLGEGTLPQKVQAMQVREITRTLERFAGNKSKAARVLGISRFSLQRLMEKFNLADDGAPVTDCEDSE